jgi:hypothetical protein
MRIWYRPIQQNDLPHHPVKSPSRPGTRLMATFPAMILTLARAQLRWRIGTLSVVAAVALFSGMPASAAPESLPDKVNLSYRLSSSLTGGTASFAWQRTGQHYQLASSIEGSGLFALVGALRQTSEGEITAQGLQPAQFSIKRGEGVADTAAFNRRSNELKLFARGENKVEPLPPRLQDTLSFLFQLAYEQRALGSPEQRISLAVSNARKIYHHDFRQAGEETVDTDLGPMKTVHLKSEAANAEDVYEVWLASEKFYLPVKLRFYAGRFLIEQTVTRISINGR